MHTNFSKLRNSGICRYVPIRTDLCSHRLDEYPALMKVPSNMSFGRMDTEVEKLNECLLQNLSVL